MYMANLGEMKIAFLRCRKGATGPGCSAGVIRDAINALTPKAVFCVGYCGSLKPDKVKLGDVVISEKLITYAASKVMKGVIEERGDKVPLKPNLSKLIISAADGWKAPLKDPKESKNLKTRRGALLSGPQVIDKKELREELLERFKEGIAIEMEGEGKVRKTSVDRTRFKCRSVLYSS